jgi:hypothetical protein
MTPVNSFTAGSSAASNSASNERQPVPLCIAVWVASGLFWWGVILLAVLKALGFV